MLAYLRLALAVAARAHREALTDWLTGACDWSRVQESLRALQRARAELATFRDARPVLAAGGRR